MWRRIHSPIWDHWNHKSRDGYPHAPLEQFPLSRQKLSWWYHDDLVSWWWTNLWWDVGEKEKQREVSYEDRQVMVKAKSRLIWEACLPPRATVTSGLWILVMRDISRSIVLPWPESMLMSVAYSITKGYTGAHNWGHVCAWGPTLWPCHMGQVVSGSCCWGPSLVPWFCCT